MEKQRAMCFNCCGTIAPDDIGQYLVTADKLEKTKLVVDFLEKAESLSGPTPKLMVCEDCAKELGLKIAKQAKELFSFAVSLGVFGAESQETNDG